MQTTTPETQIAQAVRLLTSRGWKEQRQGLPDERFFHSPNSVWQVAITLEGYWAIGKFTDADVENDAYKGGYEAVGRYETVEEDDDIAKLEEVLVSVGAIPWSCPYCGEEGGEPRTVSSREWQGDSAHGGMVYWEDECCSKCAGRLR
jgi:hypothetical protein